MPLNNCGSLYGSKSAWRYRSFILPNRPTTCCHISQCLTLLANEYFHYRNCPGILKNRLDQFVSFRTEMTSLRSISGAGCCDFTICSFIIECGQLALLETTCKSVMTTIEIVSEWRLLWLHYSHSLWAKHLSMLRSHVDIQTLLTFCVYLTTYFLTQIELHLTERIVKSYWHNMETDQITEHLNTWAINLNRWIFWFSNV